MRKLILMILMASLGFAITDNWIETNEPNIRPFNDSKLSYKYILNRVIVGKYHEVRERSDDGTEYLHTGIDYALNKNTPIIATGGGVITYAEWCHGYGNTIIIEHDKVVYTLYAHLQRFQVLHGTIVHRGDIIGYVGSTGTAYGNHVHYEMRKNGKTIFPGHYINLKRKRHDSE